ncbi:HD-GYP domain-containing protein [Marinimicrobium alkaliphilum]|uniref:HD-GYP domain-containing protein n=1 Tax=Marinimicrobium alkaliphilum TaxID=2202654 RepID=UPI000DB96017|nr:HD-GYP domain-containing protein [Marinimicrobium alkaliphilum]
MAVKQVKLDVSQVTVGMFVSGLDRPWSQTPFALQGFPVKTQDDIRLLQSLCKQVSIDVARCDAPARANLRAYAYADRKPSQDTAPDTRRPQLRKLAKPVAPIKVEPDRYPVTHKLSREIQVARQTHLQACEVLEQTFERLKEGADGSVAELREVAGDLVDSALRNPDAITWVARIEGHDRHTYDHAVRASVWGILLGRHMGLSKPDLEALAQGLLLKDVGKTRLDRVTLENAERTPWEEEQYRRFVNFGVEILRTVPNIDPRVMGIVKTHCERLNGTGFPLGLKGDKIPLLGRIAGIVTFYDEITYPRAAQEPLAPSKAVARLYEQRNIFFQEQLVVEFIRAIGLYPTGSLVELDTGEIAVVVEQNFKWRLKPRVVCVLDRRHQPVSEYEVRDLAAYAGRLERGERFPDPDGYRIMHDLRSEGLAVDLELVRDFYLHSRRWPTWLPSLGLAR